MLRRAFLDEHGLRFPGGRRRLEDHVFMTKAYFAAKSITVLSDYVCYFHTQREDLGNAGRHRMDPVGYFGNLREAIDVVEANTEPGPFRNRLLHRPLAIEMVQRARGRQLLGYPRTTAGSCSARSRSSPERFPPEVDQTLSPGNVVIAKLLRAGDEDMLLDYARWESTSGSGPRRRRWSGPTPRCSCGSAAGSRSAGPRRAGRTPAAGPPRRCEADAPSYVQVPPELLPAGFDQELLRQNPRVGKALVTFRLRDAMDRARHEVPSRLVELPVTGPMAAGPRRSSWRSRSTPENGRSDTQFAPGVVDLSAEIRFAGWALTRRVELPEHIPLPGAALENHGIGCGPTARQRATSASLSQRRPPGAGGIRGTVALTGAQLDLALNGVGRLPADVTVAVTRGSRRIELPVTSVRTEPAGDGVTRVTASAEPAVPPGRWKVLLGIGGGSPEAALARPLVRAAEGGRARRSIGAVTALGRRLLRR